jgi:hypothetical protein
VTAAIDPDECPRCDGDGEIGIGGNRCTCPVCRGSGLSGTGEAKLRAYARGRERIDARMAAIVALGDARRTVRHYIEHHVTRPANFVGLLPDLESLSIRFERASSPYED